MCLYNRERDCVIRNNILPLFRGFLFDRRVGGVAGIRRRPMETNVPGFHGIIWTILRIYIIRVITIVDIIRVVIRVVIRIVIGIVIRVGIVVYVLLFRRFFLLYISRHWW